MKYTHEDGAPFTKQEFLQKLKTDKKFNDEFGNKGIDQISDLIKQLKENPDSRRLLVSAWNPSDLPHQVLPPCHYGFQVYTRELSFKERRKLLEEIHPLHWMEQQLGGEDIYTRSNIPTRSISLMWNQRSVDTFLGLPFNIASYGLLLEIIAKEVNMVPDELIGNLGDTHLYLNHIEQAKEQIGSELSLDERANLHPTPEMFYDIHGTFSISDSIENSNMSDENRVWLHKQFDQGGIPKRTREPYSLPTLVMVTNPELKFDEYVNDNFRLVNYQSHPTIKAPLSN